MAISNEGISQYLCFQLGNELLAIEVGKVREVLEYIKITSVPCAPDYLKGIINVRGSVIPVMNLQCKLGLPESKIDIHSRIIVTEIQVGDEIIVLGMIADSVKEVLDLSNREIEPPPRLGNRFTANITRGVANRDNSFIIIMDLESILLNGNIIKEEQLQQA